MFCKNSHHRVTVAMISLKMPNTTKADIANTVDQDETAHNDPSHLDLQCLPSSPVIFISLQFEMTYF